MDRLCKADETLKRCEADGFRFPLGVCPVEPVVPTTGYAVEFEPADGDPGEEDLEEWPDRYVWEVVVSAERLRPLSRMLLGLLPPRVYPIIDVLGQDAYRELDSYVTYDLIGRDRIIEASCRCADFLFEDGMIGFGAMSEEPFAYVFLDEHKIFTVRVAVELREKMERLLAAFNLREVAEPVAVDSVAHEHRSVLVAGPPEPPLMNSDQILERLREEWGLMLNVDPEANLDDAGRELGLTWWRCLVRCHRSEVEARYAEVLLAAPNLLEAERLAIEATARGRGVPRAGWLDQILVFHDRITPERLDELLREQGNGPAPQRATGGNPSEAGIIRARWLE